MKPYILHLHHSNTLQGPQVRGAALELSTICRALIADGVVNAPEALFLKEWIEKHPARKKWPFNDLVRRLDAIFSDGFASQEECEELKWALVALTEPVPESAPEPVLHNDPTKPDYGLAVPRADFYNDPPPEVKFDGHVFCATGHFIFGGRKAVEKAITDAGGSVVKQPTTATRYVVVGSVAHEDWAFGDYGTKINRAVELRRNGADIAIISEEHWRKAIAPMLPGHSVFIVRDVHEASFRTYSFSQGDVLYDDEAGYERPFSEALKEVALCIQVVSAAPGKAGAITFKFLVPNEQKTGLIEIRTYTVTQEQFRKVVIRGIIALA